MIDSNAAVRLLSDDYARSVLDELDEGPLSAKELVERLDISRPTVYRRLDSLESAGLVQSSISVRADGHHQRRYCVSVDRIRLTFESDGITVEANDRADRGRDVALPLHN
ncbi:winged helix-turn-helix domain-containing protein [Natrinema marinum]|uniref:winged helix-turn-helix domain-containing protein n=1 Tax=Natrinema marinum TaxID=2961598 RepID=UPI0020C8DF56|nr:winged helix-turn-helix domain-containing protein [Natrinema marinum]